MPAYYFSFDEEDKIFVPLGFEWNEQNLPITKGILIYDKNEDIIIQLNKNYAFCHVADFYDNKDLTINPGAEKFAYGEIKAFDQDISAQENPDGVYMYGSFGVPKLDFSVYLESINHTNNDSGTIVWLPDGDSPGLHCYNFGSDDIVIPVHGKFCNFGIATQGIEIKGGGK
jgi:hypothetical protein